MIMTTTYETGHAKNVANANLIISYITQLATIYKPSNPDIDLPNLQTLYTTAFADLQDINAALAPYTLAVDARELVFEPVNKKLTKLHKVYKATQGVSAAQLEDFMTISRKLKGTRKTQPTEPTSPDTEQTQYSVSQLSYDQRTNNFAQLIELLQNTPNYAPNETEYQVKTLQNEKTQMMNTTQQVADTYFPLNIARGKRNQTMYTGKTNLVDTFNKAKDYLFTILDTKSPEYKAIAKLKFKKISS